MLTDIINKIRSDNDYLLDRRVLHENYEWLEYFWRNKYNHGDQSFDDFITDKAKFYWSNLEMKNLAKELASIECVGSNKKTNYTQNLEIAKATNYLRFYCNLFDNITPDCNSILCRQHKLQIVVCSSANGRLWHANDNFDLAAFKAMLCYG